VRERYILVRDRAALPRYAQALIETLCAHYKPLTGGGEAT
jgi:hypothetical protein